MSKKYLYIYVPGLGGESILDRQRSVIANWGSKERESYFLEPRWRDGSESYNQKILRLLTECKENKLNKYEKVCLVGTSAGGTIGLNIYAELSKNHSNLYFVSVCGKITGSNAIGPRFSKPHPALIPSVVHSEKVIVYLSKHLKQRMLTISPLLDQVVLPRFMTIPGVKNKRLIRFGHIFSIWREITKPKRRIFKFTESGKKFI